MITKVQGQTPFQILTNNFSISPSQEGYTLQISADGKEFSDLFAVAANTTRLVSNVAANSYYRLSGNQSEVSVNWVRSCVTEGGGGEYILPPATENTLGGVKIGSGITVTADGTISADGENKTVVDFDTTTQAERASIYTELKALYDGGSGATINKDYDFYKTVDTKQGLKIDYYTFADGKLVFGKVVSPNNSADTIVYEQVVLISADGSVEVVTNQVGRPYTAGANISINNQNQISVSGLSTINGSAITAGGNLVIQGGGESIIELTQAEYDALTEYAEDTTYIITDATPINMDNYATTADTAALSGDVATLSGSVANKADKANITARSVSDHYLPGWNEQGVITGEVGFNLVSQTINGSLYSQLMRYGVGGNLPSIYAPTVSGATGSVLLSAGNTAPSWSSYKFQFITQTAYDALSTKDSTTIYFIVGD